MDELLNCPFCGSAAIEVNKDECTCATRKCAMWCVHVPRSEWNRRAPSAVEKELRDMVQAFLDLDHNDYTQDGHDTGCKWCGAYRANCNEGCILTKARALLAKKGS
jgi:hypothetical protein